jgi:hypothetical protein
MLVSEAIFLQSIKPLGSLGFQRFFSFWTIKTNSDLRVPIISLRLQSSIRRFVIFPIKSILDSTKLFSQLLGLEIL